MTGNGNGHTSVWRWAIGIVIAAQMAVMGWLSSRIEKVEQQLYQYRSESDVAVLKERLNIWVPIISVNQAKIVEIDKELSVMRGTDTSQDKRIDRLEARERAQ